jgi:hypothetical protein
MRIDINPFPKQVIFIHKLCPHGSGANFSSKVRWSMDMRYMAAGLPSGRDCWPSFVAQSRAASLPATTYDHWQSRWAAALRRWPARAPREHTPDGPVVYCGPMRRLLGSAPTTNIAAVDGSLRHVMEVGLRVSRAKF